MSTKKLDYLGMQEQVDLQKEVIQALSEELKLIKSKAISMSTKKQDTKPMTFQKEGDYWVIYEARDKNKKYTHIVYDADVKRLYNLIKQTTGIKEYIHYRLLVELLIEDYDWKDKNLNVDSFNGGKNRAKYYFPFYFYCLKVLVFLGNVHHTKRGYVQRLK